MRRLLGISLVAALLVVPASAQDAAQDGSYGDTYTAEELAALDRALHAGNLDRRDLRFRKALTEGHGSLRVAREMLHDPLRIAPEMDRLAARTAGDWGDWGHPGLVPPSTSVSALVAAAALLVEHPGSGAMNTEDALLAGLPEPPWSAALPAPSPAEFAEALAGVAARQPRYPAARLGVADAAAVEALLDVLRAKLPAEMAWHEEFASPFEGERQAAIDAWVEAATPAALHEAAAHLTGMSVTADWLAAFGDPGHWLQSLPTDAFPIDAPLVVTSAYGRIGLGTPGDDVWTGDFAVLIDPGGNDRYVGCRIGAAFGTAGQRVGFFADLGGDDTYDCGDVNITLGAAVLGVAAFYDLGAGNDRYVGGHCSLGAAVGGTAVFYDDGGTDVYEGRTYTQGAAGFGVGVFLDDAVQARPEVTTDEGTKEPLDIALFDNDRLSAWGNAQAFARPRGVAFCINTRGNEIYEAGGVYLNAPLFSDRYQSFSQGFAIGSRGIDWAGGVAMLIDRDGNDRYLGDIYNQGVGYWYGAGLLWDGGGNDTYEMTQYGQGSGIHLAVGGLVDVAGHDTYVMHSGLGQGGSHDYAASILHDRGGNDHYHGSTSCNGCGLTNSVGIHIDRSGNDIYGARKKGGFNGGRPARDFPSIGILLDLGGKDDYLGEQEDGATWRFPDIGVGVDVTLPDATTAGGATPAADQPSGAAEIPAICSYEGELTQEVFDELWEICVRWEVGDNRLIVPEARKRVIAFGPDVLPMLDAKVETDNSGLELRAFVDVLRGLADAGARDAMLDFVRRNGAEGNERRQRVALHLVGEMKLVELEDVIVAVLGGEDAGMSRRAAGVLAQIDSHAGDAMMVGWLRGDDDRACAAAVATLVALRADVYPDLRSHLASPDFAVRGRLVTLLAKHVEAYGAAVVADVANPDVGVRALRSLLDVLARAAKTPPDGAVAALRAVLTHSDAGVRADAARVVRAWQKADVDVPGLADIAPIVDALAQDDPDALVRDLAR